VERGFKNFKSNARSKQGEGESGFDDYRKKGPWGNGVAAHLARKGGRDKKKKKSQGKKKKRTDRVLQGGEPETQEEPVEITAGGVGLTYRTKKETLRTNCY